MKNNDWKIVLSTIIYTVLFYQQESGVNSLIFSILMIVLTALQNFENTKKPAWLTVAFGTLISGFFVFYYGTELPKKANTISLLFLAGISFKPDTSLILSGLNSLTSYILAIPLLILSFFKSKFSKNQTNEKEQPKKSNTIVKKILLLMFPLFVVFVFFVLYRGSNPLFLKITEDINLDWLSFPLIQFFLSALLMMYAFFIQNTFKPINTFDENLKDDINFITEELHAQTFTNKFLSFESEKFVGISLLVMLNLLIAFLNTVDVNYLWLKADLPQGLVFSDYLHDGTFTLIVSILFAIFIIIFFFRGVFNFNKSGKYLKILGYLWVFQNIIMIISAMLRNKMYIADYGMTHKRIGVYIFLILSVIGLIVTIFKIALKKNTAFLIRKNTWAFYVFLIITTLFNWDMIITRHNISLAESKFIVDLDENYLAKLSHVNTYALAIQESDTTPFDIYKTKNMGRWNVGSLQEKIQKLLDYENRNHWQESCLNKNENIKKLKELNDMGKIAKLDLYSMYIDDITEYKTLSNIKGISLQNNQLEDNLKGLENYQKLEVVNLSKNNITHLDSFPLLKNLTHLNLENNNIKNFSFLQKNTPNITFLNISNPNTQLEEEDFPVLSKLENLNLSKTRLDSWKFLGNQLNLKEIIYTNSNVEDIVLTEMSSLEKIDLSSTQLFIEFLDSLSLSKNIKEINFNNCNLTYDNYLVNGSDPLYPNLESLNLSKNNLFSRIENLQVYKKIKNLNLSNNLIEDISPIKTMVSLENLNISNNDIRKLSELSQLQNLKVLDVSNCKLDDYEGLLQLKNLISLNLSKNKIDNIDSIISMKAIKKLYLNDNKIKDITALLKLKHLTHLYIANNYIKDYSILYEMKNLKYLSIGNVDLSIIEKIKLALPNVEIDYYSNNLSKNINYNNKKRSSWSTSF